jgi:hypothetical protein
MGGGADLAELRSLEDTVRRSAASAAAVAATLP